MNSYKKARRIIYNPHANDWNLEPEYKLQKVRIYGESKGGKSYIIDSYGNKKFNCDKTQIFFTKQNFIDNCNNINGFKLTEGEKQYLINSFDK